MYVSEIGGKSKEMLRKSIFIVLHPNRIAILSLLSLFYSIDTEYSKNLLDIIISYK